MSCCLLADLVGSAHTLETWPLELIDWPVSNINRLDVQVSPYPTRSGTPEMEELLPYDEIRYCREASLLAPSLTCSLPVTSVGMETRSICRTPAVE